MDILTLHHVALVTANFAQLQAFYVDVLGLPVVRNFVGYQIVFLGAGTTTIELISEADAPVGVVGGWNHLALAVADVDAAYAELTAKGVTFHVSPMLFPPRAPVVRIAFCRDPDGNEIELLQTLDQA